MDEDRQNIWAKVTTSEKAGMQSNCKKSDMLELAKESKNCRNKKGSTSRTVGPVGKELYLRLRDKRSSEILHGLTPSAGSHQLRTGKEEQRNSTGAETPQDDKIKYKEPKEKILEDHEVKWVRHSNCGQQQDHEPIPGELDVIAEVKERVRLHSIETTRKLFLAKNDKLRIRVKCLGKIPVFTLDGEGPSNTKEVAPKKKTTKVKGKKDVGPSDPVRPNKKGVSLGGRGMPKPLAANEYSWALQIYKKYELCVSRMKAFKAKSAALNQVKGDYSQQYTMLRDYCLELRRANHDTTIKIEVERDSDTDLQTRVFKRIYICLGPLKKGFKACGRDLLGLDGTFMKGPYPGQLLTTVGLDGNNGIYPLAYAIGITIAMTNVSPCTEHRCVAATTIPYFNRATEELKQFNKQAFEWLAKIPAHSRAKSDILLNNLCECFNGKILDARDVPIITALEYIRDREYLMRRMVNVIVVINKTDGPLTPSTTKLLKVAMDKANKYTVGFNGGKSMSWKAKENSMVGMGSKAIDWSGHDNEVMLAAMKSRYG
ncbi:hypothetical protein Tco_0316921 [Tanacetum coccineum]